MIRHLYTSSPAGRWVMVWFLFLSAALSAQNENVVIGSAIETIYNNRVYIHELFEDCKPLVWNEKIIVPCGGNSKPHFGDLKDSSLLYWRSNSKNVMSAFFDLTDGYQRIDGKLGRLIDNDRLSKIIISILSDTISNSSYFSQTAFGILNRAIYYNYLQKNGGLLRAALTHANLSNNEKTKLLLLSNPSDSLEKSIRINDSTFPFSYRIRLGDDNAEDSLISQYDLTFEYHKKENIVKEMVYSGSRKCIVHLIKKFNDPIFKTVPTPGFTCYAESIRFPIIRELQKWHPEDCVLNRMPEYFSYPVPRYSDTIKVASFSAAFKDWAKKTYSAVPEKNDPVPNILKCRCN